MVYTMSKRETMKKNHESIREQTEDTCYHGGLYMSILPIDNTEYKKLRRNFKDILAKNYNKDTKK